jgi:DNA polymerase-3 subunit delta
LLRLSIYEGSRSEAISNQKPPIFGPRRNIILNQLKLWNVSNLKTALAYFVELDLGLRSISTQSPVEAIAERTLIRVAMLAKR